VLVTQPGDILLTDNLQEENISLEDGTGKNALVLEDDVDVGYKGVDCVQLVEDFYCENGSELPDSIKQRLF
jgi:hypothetical protein